MGGKEFRIPEGILQDGTGGIKRSGTVCKVSFFSCPYLPNWPGTLTDLLRYWGIHEVNLKEVPTDTHWSHSSDQWHDLLRCVRCHLTTRTPPLPKHPGWSALIGFADSPIMPWISSDANPPILRKSWNHHVSLCNSPLPNLLLYGMASRRLCQSRKCHSDGWQSDRRRHHEA